MHAYRIEIRIVPRRGLLDPQGKAVADALHSLGFADVADVRVGRHIVLETNAERRRSPRASAPRDVRAAARQPGDGGLRDRRGATGMKFGIVTFPGLELRLRRLPRRRRRAGRGGRVPLAQGARPAGRGRRRSCRAASATATTCAPAPSRGSARSCDEVVAHARARRRRCSRICNGFQIACEAGLLPGALLRNALAQVRLRASAPARRERRHAVHVAATRRARSSRVPDRARRRPLRRRRRRRSTASRARASVVFRYVGADGAPGAEASNPNGSMRDIAGIVSARGNVLGMMPHPERAVEPLLGSARRARAVRRRSCNAVAA